MKTMKTKSPLIAMIAIMLIFSSCSRNVYVMYSTKTQNTSKIILQPTRETSETNTYVTINDSLIVMPSITKGYAVKSVVISNVPAGNYKVNYASSCESCTEKLDHNVDVKVESNSKQITKIVPVPPRSTGSWIYDTGTYIVTFAFIALMLTTSSH